MDFELKEEHRMLKDLVRRFVQEQLLPLEPAVLARDMQGKGVGLTAEERAKVNARARELGLWGLDAPVEFDGHDLPLEAMIGVAEEIGHTIINYAIPPDSPNLHMLMDRWGPDTGDGHTPPPKELVRAWFEELATCHGDWASGLAAAGFQSETTPPDVKRRVIDTAPPKSEKP